MDMCRSHGHRRSSWESVPQSFSVVYYVDLGRYSRHSGYYSRMRPQTLVDDTMKIRKILDLTELDLLIRIRESSDQFFSEILETLRIGEQFEYSG
jgi:hypothetical protein